MCYIENQKLLRNQLRVAVLMGYIKTKGIVLKEITVGEADKILTVFSETNGMISVSVKAARKPNSRFLAVSQLFCYSNMVLFKGKKDIYNLSSAELINSFYELRTEIERLECAGDICLLVLKVIQPEEKDVPSLKLLLNALYFMCMENRDLLLIKYIFEIKFMMLEGFIPAYEGCSVCGVRTGRIFLDKSSGNFICAKCIEGSLEGEALWEISIGMQSVLGHISQMPINKLFSFRVDSNVLSEIRSISEIYKRISF
ncbi:MAG: DNA repair protein RecO [Clostridiales bacterium]|nr:DNA repair protein RecO [Clostridiales bacterium]